MSNNTKIEWTDTTWNPVTGCTKISDGCKYCYAEKMACRLQAMGCEKYKDGFKPTYHEVTLDDPSRWRKPRMVFVNSMSDTFHENIESDAIFMIFQAMYFLPQHTFQVLTKRANRMKRLLNEEFILGQVSYDDVSLSRCIPCHVWLGVTVESAKYLDRIEHLRETRIYQDGVRFISFEPLLGSVGQLDLSGISWVIVGGESGSRARPMNPDWVREIRDQCVAAGVPFFFKQWGGVNKKKAGRLLDGREWNEYPAYRVIATPSSLETTSTSQEGSE